MPIDILLIKCITINGVCIGDIIIIITELITWLAFEVNSIYILYQSTLITIYSHPTLSLVYYLGRYKIL